MTSERFMRILMACLLSIWSPAWCQCMVLAVATTDEHSQQLFNETFTRAIDSDSSNAHIESWSDECCDESGSAEHATLSAVGDIQFAAAVDCCPGNCDDGPAGSPCQCLCCGQILAATPTASASIAIDAVHLECWFGALLLDLSTDSVLCHLRLADLSSRQLSMAAVSTLLSQRCLLLI